MSKSTESADEESESESSNIVLTQSYFIIDMNVIQINESFQY
jgi:hypothetical protein